MTLWVLAIVARPMNWWKILLWVGCVTGYVVLFLTPAIRDVVMLDISNHRLMLLGAIVGLCGAGLIEVVNKISRRYVRRALASEEARDAAASEDSGRH